MPAEAQTSLGSLEAAVNSRLELWESEGIGRRIWDKDPTVWAETDLPELTDRLGWLSLPAEMAQHVPELESFAAEIRAEGFTHVVLLGMGGSSLAPEVYQSTFGNAAGYPELIVLDSTHPGAVRAVDERINLATTLFLVASKSGTTLETLSFFRYFWGRLVADGFSPGSRFVALTDPGSALVDLAEERRFRRVFLTTPAVGGRYSALTFFGLLPAALIGVEVGELLRGATAMAVDCGPSIAAPANPGLVLGAVLGEAAVAGRDKATFLVSESLAAFPVWVEQLIAESTGKDGMGIVPVAGEPLGPPPSYWDDRVFIHYQLAGDAEPEGLDALAKAGHPVVTIDLESRQQLGAEMFRAELATAAAGAILGIHPFNQPDVQIAKELARQAMAGELGGGAPIVEITPDDSAAVGTWLGALPEHGYVSLQAYAPMGAATIDAVDGLRGVLRASSPAAVTVGFGPRFLHSTGQLHKGGPSHALFLQLMNQPPEDVDVPETDFSFGELIAGQAEGDYRALQERARKVLRIQLGSDAVAGLRAVADTVSGLG